MTLKLLPTIRKIPDDLWDEIKLLLPSQKANNAIGRPLIPFRKVMDSIVYVLRTRILELSRKNKFILGIIDSENY